MDSPWTPAEIFRLDVRQPIRLLNAVFDLFCGENATVILQGDLLYFDPRGLTIEAQEPEAMLAEAERPKKGIVAVALNAESQTLLERNLFTRAGIRSRINHVLVIQNDELVFAAFDRFYEDCVWVTASVGDAWPTSLKETKIIAGYQRWSSTRERYHVALEH